MWMVLGQETPQDTCLSAAGALAIGAHTWGEAFASRPLQNKGSYPSSLGRRHGALQVLLGGWGPTHVGLQTVPSQPHEDGVTAQRHPHSKATGPRNVLEAQLFMRKGGCVGELPPCTPGGSVAPPAAPDFSGLKV